MSAPETSADRGAYMWRESPPCAGYWQIGGPQGLRIAISRRPRFLARLVARWLLEWQWIEADK